MTPNPSILWPIRVPNSWRRTYPDWKGSPAGLYLISLWRKICIWKRTLSTNILTEVNHEQCSSGTLLPWVFKDGWVVIVRGSGQWNITLKTYPDIDASNHSTLTIFFYKRNGSDTKRRDNIKKVKKCWDSSSFIRWTWIF